MKNLFYITLVTIASLVMVSCDSTTDPVTPDPKGNLFVTSVPAGAQIWVDGVNKNKVTPDTVKDIIPGLRNVTLKLQDYSDTTFSVSVTSGQTSVVTNVALVSNISKTFYGGSPIRIYETIGTTALQPSGLDLSSGKPWGVSSDSSGRVDIYYSSNGYLVQSANSYPGLIRETDFYKGGSSNIYDEIDSPLNSSGTWVTNIPDTVTSYVFLYDHDGHYSKLKIVGMGGGQPNVPAWIDVQWWYNNTALDNRF